jgi:predicted nucleic acid-binding Zn ribbon protein
MADAVCIACGQPLGEASGRFCTDCQTALDNKRAREQYYRRFRSTNSGMWLLTVFSFWVIGSVVWFVLVSLVGSLLSIDLWPWAGEAIDGIIPTDYFRLALLLSGPVIFFVLFFGLGWGGTLFNRWPRRRKGSGPSYNCVTCGSVGVEGELYPSSLFGEIFICNRCLSARMRDNRLFAGFSGIILTALFVGLGLSFFNPNLGGPVTSTSLNNGNLTTTTVSTPALEGLAGTVFAYIPGAVLVLLGVAAGGLSLWYMFIRSKNEARREIGRKIIS